MILPFDSKRSFCMLIQQTLGVSFCLNTLRDSIAIDVVVSSSSNTSDSKLRILVVDDEPDILFTLNAVLSEQGHYVKTFDNPVEALSHLTRRSISVIIIMELLHPTMT
jgi:PleD family two-component response regulator